MTNKMRKRKLYKLSRYFVWTLYILLIIWIFDLIYDGGLNTLLNLKIFDYLTMLSFLYIFLIISLFGYIFMPWLSGWKQLEKNYKISKMKSIRWQNKFQSGKINKINYEYKLKISANKEGITLAVVFPFNYSHSPLLLPWHDIRIETDDIHTIGNFFKRKKVCIIIKNFEYIDFNLYEKSFYQTQIPDKLLIHKNGLNKE